MAEERVQRRLAAILAADVVGYSRLMAADESGTLSRLKALRSEIVDPGIAARGGRIFKQMGDGLLIEFASVVDAVECAVQVQDALAERSRTEPPERRIQYRMGVNLGDIVVDGGDIFGDGVNISARMEGLAEPGGLCLSAAAFQQLRGKTRHAFRSIGPQTVKNIAEPIEVYRLARDDAGETAATTTRRAAWRLLAAALTVVLLAIAAVFAWQQIRKAESPPEAETAAAADPDRPSIAVLPFTNMSDDPSQDYFVDGMTEDIITDLSKVSALLVIARNSVFTYKDRAVRPEQVARELGVRYILEGSARKSGDRVRINAQLIDAHSGGHIWADRFDRELGDVFALQDDVTRTIVDALALELTSAEQTRLSGAGRTTSPEVYDLYLRGVEALRGFTPESIKTSRTLFLKALSIDPSFARAYAMMAFSYSANPDFIRSDRSENALAEALYYAERALELDETLPQGYFATAITLLRLGRHDDALAAARKAVEYDPNYADGYVALANVLNFSGDGDEGERMMRRAMELNPHYSAAYLDILGRAQFVTGRYDDAIATLDECVSRDPAAQACRLFLAAAYSATDNIEDAQWQAQEVLNLDPGYSIDNDTFADQFKVPEQRDRYRSGLEKDGIPKS